jgi:hypothetical protein
MTDPFNQLPIDPDWVRKVDSLTAAAARTLECTVVTIALKENGKLGVAVEGIPDAGPLRELVSDVPRLLRTIAAVCVLQDAVAADKGTQH